jgi:hypothetical protein
MVNKVNNVSALVIIHHEIFSSEMSERIFLHTYEMMWVTEEGGHPLAWWNSGLKAWNGHSLRQLSSLNTSIKLSLRIWLENVWGWSTISTEASNLAHCFSKVFVPLAYSLEPVVSSTQRYAPVQDWAYFPTHRSINRYSTTYVFYKTLLNKRRETCYKLTVYKIGKGVFHNDI